MVDHGVVGLLGQPFAVQPGGPLAFAEQQQRADDLVARLRRAAATGRSRGCWRAGLRGPRPAPSSTSDRLYQASAKSGATARARAAGRFGLGRATLPAVHDAQVAERRGGFRLARGDGDAAFVGLHRVVDPPRAEQDVAQVVPRAGVLRDLQQRRGDQLDGFVDCGPACGAARPGSAARRAAPGQRSRISMSAASASSSRSSRSSAMACSSASTSPGAGWGISARRGRAFVRRALISDCRGHGSANPLECLAERVGRAGTGFS